jgi:hypothetical protein
MKALRAGRPSRHRRTMELLAQARPAWLDPAPPATSLHSTPPHCPRPGPASAAVTTLLRTARDRGQAGPPAAAPPRERPRYPVHRHPVHRHRTALAAATLAAAAVAVLLASGGLAPGPGSRSQAAGRAAGLSARQILLTAAVSAARQPAEGRYWRVEAETAMVVAAGPNAHPYAVEQRWGPSLTWDARSPGQRTWTFPATGYRSAPATPGAAAAWRADGSPKLPAQDGPQQAWWQTGGAVGYLGNDNLTFAQFQRLPSSPAALAAVVTKAAEQQIAPPPPTHGVRTWSIGGGQPSLSQAMFGVYDQLLKLDPISPQVRAAVFRDLAGLPGVRSIGKVTDPLGRTGDGIALAPGRQQLSDRTPLEEVLVIAPGSGLLLADEFVAEQGPSPGRRSGAAPGQTRCPGKSIVRRIKGPACLERLSGHLELVSLGPAPDLSPGQVESYDVIVTAGWTNASPPLPPRSQQFSVAKDGKG